MTSKKVLLQEVRSRCRDCGKSMTAPRSNLRHLFSIHPHHNCCYGNLLLNNVVYVQGGSIRGITIAYYRLLSTKQTTISSQPYLQLRLLQVFVFLLIKCFAISTRFNFQFSNPFLKVIIYGGIQQDGIILSVHTKTVDTSLKRSITKNI